MNRQLEQAQADIVMLKLAKQQGLADPISLAEKLRDGVSLREILLSTCNWKKIIGENTTGCLSLIDSTDRCLICV